MAEYTVRMARCEDRCRNTDDGGERCKGNECKLSERSYPFTAERLRELEERVAELPKDPAVLVRLIEQRHLLEYLAWDNCPEWVALKRALSAHPKGDCCGANPCQWGIEGLEPCKAVGVNTMEPPAKTSPSSTAPLAPPLGWWSFLRSVLSQGASIQQDYMAGTHKSYEEYSARLDAAGRERAEEIAAVLAPRSATEPLTMNTGGGDLEILRMALSNTAHCLGDALATYNRLVGKDVFVNSGSAESGGA